MSCACMCVSCVCVMRVCVSCARIVCCVCAACVYACVCVCLKMEHFFCKGGCGICESSCLKEELAWAIDIQFKCYTVT